MGIVHQRFFAIVAAAAVIGVIVAVARQQLWLRFGFLVLTAWLLGQLGQLFGSAGRVLTTQIVFSHCKEKNK